MMGTLRAVIAQEVEKQMGRQTELLEQIARYLGVPTTNGVSAVPAPKRATPTPPRRRQAKGEPAPKKRGRPRTTAKGATSANEAETSAAPFKQGQEVRYKQGRGTFPAVVKAVDAGAGTVTLERQGDGKQVVRPYSKVEAA
ncbi:PspA [Myxococcus sp. CA039A]|uniref:PspA n=1 Tax=Myxococcus sp. CA039A TaxID=2741737 RepID=UPI0027B911E2|nr:PspA [Myxococcus sp. CA039A]